MTVTVLTVTVAVTVVRGIPTNRDTHSTVTIHQGGARRPPSSFLTAASAAAAAAAPAAASAGGAGGAVAGAGGAVAGASAGAIAIITLDGSITVAVAGTFSDASTTTNTTLIQIQTIFACACTGAGTRTGTDTRTGSAASRVGGCRGGGGDCGVNPFSEIGSVGVGQLCVAPDGRLEVSPLQQCQHLKNEEVEKQRERVAILSVQK